MNTDKIKQFFREVFVERRRQDVKFPDQHLPDGTGHISYMMDANTLRQDCDAAAKAKRLTWRHIFMEEVYEAVAEKDQDKLRTELVQVASVCARWVEEIDTRKEQQ